MAIKRNLIFFIILGLYLLVSLYRLQDIPPPWYDEMVHLNVAQHIAQEGRIWCDFYTSKFEGALFNSMPLQWILLGAYVKIFGLELFNARFLYIILSLITLSGVSLLTYRMFNRRVALYSLVFLASNYIFFHNSRQLIPQVPATTFSIFALLFFYIAKQKDSKLLFAASGLSAGLACLSHPTGLVVLLVIAIFFYDKIPIKHFLLYLGSAFFVGLPYMVHIIANFQELLHQADIILNDVYVKQSILLNMLDEIPVRYLSLPPLRDAFVTSLAEGGKVFENKYLYTLKRLTTHLNLKIYFCKVVVESFFLLSLAYFGLKKFKTAKEKELFFITVVYILLMSLHPNKFNSYIYIVSPFFCVCFAIFINDLLDITLPIKKIKMKLRSFLAVFLVAIFFGSNLLFVYKDLSTKKIKSYSGFIENELMPHIPKGSYVAGPPYFWLGMHKDYNFISANQIVYEVDKILKEEKGGARLDKLSEKERNNIIKKTLAKYKIEYVLITCHLWPELTEAVGTVGDLASLLRRYIFYNAEKKKDFLKIHYYTDLPDPKKIQR